MKPTITVYRTLVKGGWRNSVCCTSAPLRYNDDAFYCHCEDAKAIMDNNPSADDWNPKFMVVPDYRHPIEEYLDAPNKKEKPYTKKSSDKDKGDLPW